MNVNNIGLLGGTKRRTLKQRKGGIIRPCGMCTSRPLGPHVTGPILRKGDLVTIVSGIPYDVRLASGIISTRHDNTLPLGALTGTILTGRSRVRRVTRRGCQTTRTRQSRNQRHAVLLGWSGGPVGAATVGRGDPHRRSTTRRRATLLMGTLGNTITNDNC